MAMEHIERVEKQILATSDILDNEETELSYAIAHFMNVLRESNVDIPTSTTREISLAIADVAKDPKMYPKLLNEKWVRNLMKSFIAKSEDQARIFDTQFSQALEMGVKREELKERAKYNIAMASIGNHVIQKLPSEYKNNLKNPYTAPGNKERTIADIPVTDTIKKMIDFLAKKGFNPRKSPVIRKKVASIISKSRIRPVDENSADVDRDFEPVFLDAITEQFENDVKLFNENRKIDEWLTSKQEYDEYQRKFSTKDFTEEWMIDVIMHLYGVTSPSLDATINEFFMMQHQKAIENAIDASTRSREDGGVNPNFLLGAINDYLKAKHGDSNVPRIYDFPLRTATISESIDLDAVTAAAELIGGSKTFKGIRKNEIPIKYGNNLVNRSLFLRALKKHMRTELSSLASILSPDMSRADLASIARSIKGMRDELDNREKKEKQTSSTVTEDVFSDFYATVKTAQADVSLVSKATTNRERMIANVIKFVERAIQVQKIPWTFKAGAKKGQTVEAIDNIDDYLEYLDEDDAAKQANLDNVDDMVRSIDDIKNKKPKPFLSRKDIRDLEKTLSNIPDAEKRRVARDAFDIDFEKYKKNYDDALISMMEKSEQASKFKDQFSNTVRKVDIPAESLSKLGDIVERSGNEELKKKFKSLVDKKSSFSASEMKTLLDIAKQLQDKKSIEKLESMFDAKMSASDASKIRDAMSRSGKLPSTGKVSKMLDTNTFSGKDIEKINDLLQSADSSSRSRVQDILGNMGFSKSEAGKIEAMARQDPSLQKAVQDAFDGGKTSISKIKKLNDAINASADDALKKKLKKSVDGMEFSSSGMNDLADALDSLADKKVKAAMEKIASKKLSASDAATLDDLSRDITSVDDEKIRKSVEKAVSNVDFTFKGFNKLKDAIDSIDNKYDVKKSLQDTVGKKPVSFEGKDIDDIKSMIDALSRNEKNDAEDMIDAGRFTKAKKKDIAKSLDGMDDDEKIKEQIRKAIDSIEGKSVDADALQKAKQATKDLDKEIKDKIDDIIGRAEKAGKQEQMNELADLEDSIANRMDADTDANSDLKKNDLEAWKWSKESAKFIREHAKGLRDGTANPSELFGQMSGGKDINIVMRRLAKTPYADNIAMGLMSSMHEMFNKFAADASTEERRALFSQIATKLSNGQKQVQEQAKQFTLDKERRERLRKANEHNKEMQEKFNERMSVAKKWFDDHGLDINAELRDRISLAVRSDPAGSKLIPPAGMTRLDFGKHGRRRDDICLASKKRRFIVPDLEDVAFYPEVGDERTPFAVVNFAGDRIGDTVMSHLEKFGNYDAKKAIENLEGGKGPGGDGFGPSDPGAIFDQIINNLEKTTVEDVALDWQQKLGDELGRQLVDEVIQDISNQKPWPESTDQIDINANIDVPHVPSPFDKNKSGGQRMTVESKDPRTQPPPPTGGEGTGDGKRAPPSGTTETYTDVGIDFQDAVKDLTNDFISGSKDLNGAQYDGTGIIDPEEWFERGKKLTNSQVEKYLEEMIKTPENAALMRRYFRSFFRKPLSDIMKMKHGKRKLSAIDGRSTIHRAIRNGRDPRTDMIPVTKLIHRIARNVKRDIFTVDISGSMSSYLGVVSQLIASLAEPQYLKVVLFDTDAIPIDPSVFKKNPAVIFHDTHAFIEESAKKLDRKWTGAGSTSYSRAFDEFGDEPGKIKIAKGDRLVLIGDLEHNTLANTPGDAQKYEAVFNAWKRDGICKPSHEEFDCIAAWYASLCSKADSCIAINPKVSVGSNDLTCSLIAHGVPTCFTGALSGSGGKATENDNFVLGEGLKRTVDCLKMAMTGEKPKINERVTNFCQKGGTGTVNPFLEGED